MNLRGWIRTSLIEYTGHLATVLFVGGCSFRCPMCHNAELVLRADGLPPVDEAEVWQFLKRRHRLISGVVISGGEPTLDPDLDRFLHRLRQQPLAIKLDTNGYRPDVLSALLSKRLVDYVALDIKAPPAKYPLLTGVGDVDIECIARSVALLRTSGIAHEFRTTVVPGLLDEEDIRAIADWIAGAERYVLQQFRPLVTLDPALASVKPFPVSRLAAMAEIAGREIAHVAIRGA